jgi:hypothetical protein
MLGACGSSSPHGDQPDANTSGFDAGTTGGMVDDFGSCVAASTKPAEMCKNAQSDCLPDPANQSFFVCLPKCTTSTDCDISTFCVPDAGGNGGAVFGAIADHCYTAYCGQLNNPAVNNGMTGQPCMVGAQTGENDITGWCYPIIDASYGVCFDSGTATSGMTCDPNAKRGQSTLLCDDTSLCITSKNPPSNKCDTICDPSKISMGDPTGGCTGTKENCYDISTMQKDNSGAVVTSTIAFCDSTITACDVTKTGQCAALSVAGNLWGCVPSTAVRSDGFCDPEGAGNLAIGMPCDLSMLSTGDATQCVDGSMCYQDSSATTGTCSQICSFEAGGTACTTGSCTKITIDPGSDGQLGTADDQISQTWGICK